MIFELISWIYISLICLVWGNRILKIFFGIYDTSSIDFPVVFLIGMSVLGIFSVCIALIIPLFMAVKLALQIPALLVLLNSSSRKEIFCQLKKPFAYFSVMDFVLLSAALLMILFLCSAPIIHPDTLNYHVFSIQVFDHYGSIPGIANLKPEYGFQSLWFAVTAFFDFPFVQSVPWYPLNGCVMAWVVLFLILKGAAGKKKSSDPKRDLSGIWYFLLMLFSIISWTQIRLTASSLSPDFICTIYIILAFYLFTGEQEYPAKEKSGLLAVLFSTIAVSVKLSAIPVLLIPLLITGYELTGRRFLSAIRNSLLALLILTPVIIRNIISSGYPFYPSSFAAIYHADWALKESQVLQFQHYITSYARYPILYAKVAGEYNNSIATWFSIWWKNLYIADKAVIWLIAVGCLLDICFFRRWIKEYSPRKLVALFIVIAGIAFWMIKAPDPRFGTGFLLPFIYFLYFPFIKRVSGEYDNSVRVLAIWIRNILAALLILYTGYRAVFFFHPGQLVFPDAIKNYSIAPQDCDANIRKMVLEEKVYSSQFPDSCMHFSFRGTAVKQGFKAPQ